MRYAAGSGLCLGLAALLTLGCGKKQPDDMVTVPSALLGSFGMACRTVHLTKEEAKQLRYVRVTFDWQGAPRDASMTQTTIRPAAQTIYVVTQVQQGSHRLSTCVGTQVDGEAGWSGTTGTVDTPFDLGELAIFKSSGPLALRIDQPQHLMTAGRGSATSNLNDPVNLVKVSVMATTREPGTGPARP